MSKGGSLHLISLDASQRDRLRSGSVYQSGGVVVVPERRRAEVDEFLTGKRLSEGTHVVYCSDYDLARLSGETTEPPIIRTDDPAVVLCAREVESEALKAFDEETGDQTTWEVWER